MFLETKKEGENQTTAPSLAGFIAWLEKRPSDQIYNVYDPQVCAYAQYSGRCLPGATEIAAELGISHEDACRIIGEKPHTFGAALERARMVLPKADTTPTD